MQQDDGRLEVYLAHRSALVDYATPIMGSRAHAEDVVQDAYFRFVRVAEVGAGLEQPVAYLYRVVRNLALDALRRRSNEQQQQAEPVSWQVPPGPATPEQQAVDREALHRVIQALAELPFEARLAFEMKRLGGFTLQQIAVRLGISVPSAHRLVRDAMLKVALKLREPEN